MKELSCEQYKILVFICSYTPDHIHKKFDFDLMIIVLMYCKYLHEISTLLVITENVSRNHFFSKGLKASNCYYSINAWNHCFLIYNIEILQVSTYLSRKDFFFLKTRPRLNDMGEICKIRKNIWPSLWVTDCLELILSKTLILGQVVLYQSLKKFESKEEVEDCQY